MRLKTLLHYHLTTIIKGVIIFYSFYTLGMLLAGISTSLAHGDAVVMGVSGVAADGSTQTWSSGIVAFGIFMLISSLIGSQPETRFLITRSVSRKEIFVSNALFLFPLAAIMSTLQMIGIHIDGFVRYLLTGEFRGLKLDVQSMQAPDMNNYFVFFLVSFSIMLCLGAVSYLLGSLLARWKIPTIGVLAVSFITLLSCMLLPGVAQKTLDVLTFLFTDTESGLWIALKQTGLAVILMAIAFPVMRRITAMKSS